LKYPMKQKARKRMEIYITIAIETEENDIEIGVIRAENGIEEEEIEVHNTCIAELSPSRGFPITTGVLRTAEGEGSAAV